MKSLDIAQQRLLNQRLITPDFQKPAEVVKWMGAVQAQDYHGAKWALGLRMQDATDDSIESAFAEGSILRTHVMRPTWHFVTPDDIRWMLMLTAPRVNAALASIHRKLGLDDATFKLTNKVLARTLRGGKHLTRDVLRTAIQQAGVSTDDMRFLFILARAELDGLICSGPRKGKQFTYALLEERVPLANPLSRDEALAELTRRYFASHGPASVRDFVWWSGLTTADASAGIQMLKSDLVHEVIEGKSYWMSSSMSTVERASHAAFLLPMYDEYLVAYKDRSAALSPAKGEPAVAGNPIFSSPVVITGRVVGSWKGTVKDNSLTITIKQSSTLNEAQRRAVARAARLYGAFLGLPAVLAEDARKRFE